jgi:predicted transcriptional regulator YdeE
MIVKIEGQSVRLIIHYDFRAFLDFYRNQAGEAARTLLFDAAKECTFCPANDKCTNLLYPRIIELGDKSKRLCSLNWSHHLNLAVDAATVGPILSIIDMAFRYHEPWMHQDVSSKPTPKYELSILDESYVVGLRHVSNMLSVRTEDFIKECFAKDDRVRCKLDELWDLTGQAGEPRYAGVTRDFINGLDYTFTLGVLCDKDHLPKELPKDAEVVKLAAGEYALYAADAGRTYTRIWEHFKGKFHKENAKGFDKSRPWFEQFGPGGELTQLAIPVADGITLEVERRLRVVKTQDTRLAGYWSFNEPDYGPYRPPQEQELLRRRFPDEPWWILSNVHARPGQPIYWKHGLELDDLEPVPDGLEEMNVRGGYWHVISYPYPAPADWVFEVPYRTRDMDVDCLAHPRDFNEYVYNARGRYTEIWAPVRIMGRLAYEVVERPRTTLLGKQAGPTTTVGDADLPVFYNHPANSNPGSCIVAFRFEEHNGKSFFAPPIARGMAVDGPVGVPEGLEMLDLPAGRYVKVTEAVPNGELGWRVEGFVGGEVEKQTGHKPDLSRQIIVEQSGFGRQHAVFVPVI